MLLLNFKAANCKQQLACVYLLYHVKIHFVQYSGCRKTCFALY